MPRRTLRRARLRLEGRQPRGVLSLPARALLRHLLLERLSLLGQARLLARSPDTTKGLAREHACM